MTVFFGWKVVATACVIATCAFGFGYYGPAVFLNFLHTQHGWSVSLISTAITVHYLVSALLVSRVGGATHRRMVEDDVAPAVVGKQAIHCGEVDARLPVSVGGGSLGGNLNVHSLGPLS
jgi:hypothetical protein